MTARFTQVHVNLPSPGSRVHAGSYIYTRDSELRLLSRWSVNLREPQHPFGSTPPFAAGPGSRRCLEEPETPMQASPEPPLPPLSCRCAPPNPHKDIDRLTRCTRCGRRCLPKTQLTLTDNEATA